MEVEDVKEAEGVKERPMADGPRPSAGVRPVLL